MRLVRTNLVSLIALIMVVAAVALPAQEPASPQAQPKNPGTPNARNPRKWLSGVAVRVNHEVITKAQVWEHVGGNRLSSATPETRNRMYEAALDQLILQTINEQAVAQLGLSITEFDKRSYIENEKERAGGEESYREMLNEKGYTERDLIDEFEQNTRRNYLIGSLAGRYKALSQDVRPEHNITPRAAEIRAWYVRHQKERYTVAREARLRFLKVTFALYGRDETKGAQAVVRKARQDLATGADFQTVAREVMKSSEESVGRPTTVGGGKEPAFPPPEEVERQAWKGTIGEVSEPISFRRGFYLVLVESRRPARILPFQEVQFQIRDELKNQKYQKAVQQVQRKFLARSYIYPKVFKTRLLAGR